MKVVEKNEECGVKNGWMKEKGTSFLLAYEENSDYNKKNYKLEINNV